MDSTALPRPEIKNVIGAARVQVDFWDPEGGYYLNGTYYGDKNLLAIGAASRRSPQRRGQPVNKATSARLPPRKKASRRQRCHDRKRVRQLRPARRLRARTTRPTRAHTPSASYLFPKPVGPGKFEILGKYAKAQFSSGVTKTDIPYNQKTSEVNFNYVIKEFNARVMSFYKNTNFTAVNTNFWQIGVGLQIQM